MAQCDRDGFARFAYKFRFKTLAEQNDKGSWHGWEMQLEGPLLDEETQKKDPAQFARNLATYDQAKSFSESVQSGNVEVKRENDDVKSGEKDQIPFTKKRRPRRGDGFRTEDLKILVHRPTLWEKVCHQ